MTLLRANIPLYLQYVTARYLQAPTGLDQLTWILEGKLFTDSVSESKNWFKFLWSSSFVTSTNS